MIFIRRANPDELAAIIDIAHRTWPETYGKILSEAQISYMLGLFYTKGSLLKNRSEGQVFLLACDEDLPIGFASFQHLENRVTRIPKIYVLPEAQGKGIGKMLIDAVAGEAAANNSLRMQLNVNRNNRARGFYERLGFKILNTEDIAIGKGYLMEDYVMEKRL